MTHLITARIALGLGIAWLAHTIRTLILTLVRITVHRKHP